MRENLQCINYFMYLCKKIIVMTRIVTSSEFKANQTHFFDMANKGERIILKSRLKGNFLLVPMSDEPAKMDEEQFYALIDHSIKQIEEGHFTKQMDGESIDDFVDRLLCTK